MPYSSTSDLPQAIRDKYGSKCSRAFLHAFNSTYAEHGESRAFAAAHAAAQRCQGGKDMTLMDVAKGAEFKIFSGALTALSGDEGERMIRTIASSSIEDNGGDVVTLDALNAMAASAKDMAIFRNHSYNVPDDVWGTTKRAEVKHAGVDGNGKPIYDLILDIKVRSDPKSVELYEAITKDGVKLGTSIGALIPPGSAVKNDAGGYTYSNLALKEASIVGIPQNPRSWVEYATKAMKIAEATPDDPNNEGFHVPVEDEGPAAPAEEPAEEVEAPAEEPAADETEKAAEPEVVKSDEEPADKPDDDEQAEEPAEEDDSEPETTTASAGPTLTFSMDGDASSEDTPAQELGESAPESAVDKASSEDAAVMDTMLTQSIDVMADAVKTLTRERGGLLQRAIDAEAARDAAVQAAKDAVANANLAMEIAKRLANTPLARKAVFKDESDQLSDAVKKVYTPGVIKMLENNDER